MPASDVELENLLQLIEREKLDLVCVSIRASAYYMSAKVLTEHMREHLDVPILWGGMHPTLMSEECIQTADMVLKGEGEHALLWLLQPGKYGSQRGRLPQPSLPGERQQAPCSVGHASPEPTACWMAQQDCPPSAERDWYGRPAGQWHDLMPRHPALESAVRQQGSSPPEWQPLPVSLVAQQNCPSPVRLALVMLAPEKANGLVATAFVFIRTSDIGSMLEPRGRGGGAPDALGSGRGA